MRRDLKEAQSKDAGRRTGTGSEVWYIRDEQARDCEVLHLQRGVLYKSGAYASKATCLTLGDLYSVLFGTEDGAIHSERCAEVSRRHNRRKETGISFGSMDELGTRPAIERAGDGNSRPKRKEIDVMPPLKA